MILLEFAHTTAAIIAMLITSERCNSATETLAMTTRRATDNSKALDAVMTTKFQIDAALKRLKALSDDHFDTHPDEITWGDVGTLNHYASLLCQITDLDRDDYGDVIIGADTDGHADLMLHMAAFLANHHQ